MHVRGKGWNLTRQNHNGQFVFRWYDEGVLKTRRVPIDIIGQREAMDWVHLHVFGIKGFSPEPGLSPLVQAPRHTPVLTRVHQLIRLANGNGGSEEEARTAALAAVRLIAKHGIKLSE